MMLLRRIFNEYQFKCTDEVVEKILFNPVKEGANRLCILTRGATPSMVSWVLKSYEELGILNVTIELIICDALNEGINKGAHESFKELHGTRYTDKWGEFFM